MAKRVAISPLSGVTVPVGGGAINANPLTQNIGVGTQVGNVNVGAGVNPVAGTVGVNAGTNVGNANVGIGANVGAGGVSIGPSLTFGSGQGNQNGAAIGGTAGAAVGTAILPGVGTIAGNFAGKLVGSVVGGLFNPSTASKETDQRKSVFNSYQKVGLFDKDGNFLMPDGSTYTYNNDATHPWTDPGKRVDKNGDRPLFSYESDYTNDLDFASSMAGLSLSRLVAGGKNKAIDQAGSSMANGFLGKVGNGAQFSQENFNKVMTNARSMYAKAGIKSKDEMLGLASQAHAQGRINDSDFATVQQTAGLVFDNDYSTASKLMAGRWKGIQTAAQIPAASQAPGINDSRDRPGRIYSPQISSEEAALSVQPLLDKYRAGALKPAKLSTGAQIAQGVAAATGIAGTIKAIDNLTGGGVKSLIGGVKDFFSPPVVEPTTLNPTLDTGSSVTNPDPYTGSAVDSNYQLPTDISYSDASNFDTSSF